MMMVPTSHASHLSLFALIGMVCFTIIMQMLGVSISLWELDAASDLVESALLEGFSIPASMEKLSVTPQKSPSFASAPLDHGILLAGSLFHPPVS